MSDAPSEGTPSAAPVSASETLLFGGELAYDTGWSRHH